VLGQVLNEQEVQELFARKGSAARQRRKPGPPAFRSAPHRKPIHCGRAPKGLPRAHLMPHSRPSLFTVSSGYRPISFYVVEDRAGQIAADHAGNDGI
jgi:hypothetical protein